MAKFIGSKKYNGVCYYETTLKNGKKDRIYYITFKDEDKRFRRVKIGRQSEGITESYCYGKRAEILQKIKLGEEVGLLTKKCYLFKDMFLDYLEYAKNNKKTWRNDESVYKNHLAEFYNRDVKKLKTLDFEKLKQKKLDEGLSPKTVHHILATIRQAYNYAIRFEKIQIPINPLTQVKFPKIDNEKIGFFRHEDARKLLEALEREDERLYFLTVLLLFTGARFSEVANLTWNDVNFEQKLIYFPKTKDGNARHVKMTSLVESVLKRLRAEGKGSLVIPNTNDERYKQMPKKWQKIVDRLIPGNENAGKARLTVHSLRHTHASWLAIEGLDILQIKEQLGHKKIETTMRYAHLIPHKRHEMTLSLDEKVLKSRKDDELHR